MSPISGVAYVMDLGSLGLGLWRVFFIVGMDVLNPLPTNDAYMCHELP